MPIIKFIKENVKTEAPAGTNLRKAALDAGVNPHSILNGMGAKISRALLNCHGLAQCGTCRVRIVKGMENTSPMGMLEGLRFRNPLPDPLPALAYVGNEDTMRLSCQTLIHGDVEVETAPELDLFGENFF
ncbi:MAG TPA: 2Fe-2S iron-sulfur cluster-binding protein, partial [Lacipirellulaceae bacterium]|nr:2Fe-2S iron-sulfur cluster-binding protein [Lacipirellulaceae bacterium]